MKECGVDVAASAARTMLDAAVEAAVTAAAKPASEREEDAALRWASGHLAEECHGTISINGAPCSCVG